MAKYDLFRNPGGPGYLLDVQTDLLAGLNTRIMVPLLPVAVAPAPAKRLNPVFDLPVSDPGDGPHVMVTQFLSAVPVSRLKAPAGNMGAQFSEVTAAIDLLLQGF